MKGQIFIGSPGDNGWTMEVAEVTNMPGDVPYMLAFAQDAAGEVYALTSITTGSCRFAGYDLQDRSC